MTFVWTDKAVEITAKMLRDGALARDIANALGASRNAVISKIRRTKELADIGLLARPKGRPVGSTPKSYLPRKPRGRVVPKAEHVKAVQMTYVIGVPLLDIGNNECRWPVAGEKAAMLMCGAPIVKGQAFRYCRAHQERARAA